MWDRAVDVIVRYGEGVRDSKALMRLLYLECVHNADLLKLIQIEKVSSDTLSPPARKILASLDVSILTLVFAGEDASSQLRADLKRLSVPEIKAIPQKKRSLLGTCKGVLISVRSISVLADAYTESANDCKTSRLGLRLKNLSVSLRVLERTLATHKAVRTMFTSQAD
jgi:hypothetical protein